MKILLKNHLLWILFFGTLIGVNETLIGNFNLPYRSVVLSTITLCLLSLARYYYPQKGTSILIILIAVLFKFNNAGIQHCTSYSFLCAPIALLLLGIGYEAFASILMHNNRKRLFNYGLSCILTSLLMFTLFAVLETYLFNNWNFDRFVNYVLVKGPLTAATSSLLSVLLLSSKAKFRPLTKARLHPHLLNGMLGIIIVMLWLL